MINQKAISVKVYEDILAQFDAQLGAYEKRNQAINKAMEIYIDLMRTREKIDQKRENFEQVKVMMADFYKRANSIAKCWRIR